MVLGVEFLKGQCNKHLLLSFWRNQYGMAVGVVVQFKKYKMKLGEIKLVKFLNPNFVEAIYGKRNR